ncbi:MAG: DUF2460 domain-containing protein [Betaproteobacteria bacterium]|nr:DUF2460 domain-containing protein [Betaproteobacteria bacterium]
MAFIETPIFPEHISAGCKFGPAYSTSIARNLGGYEANNQNWLMPLYEGDVGHAAMKQALFNDLLAFFHGVAGMHNAFRFKHFADWTVTGSQGTLVALSATTWQMYKTYTYGALTKARKISKPIAGATILGTGSYTVDTTSGIITKTAGADPTGWTGQFHTPVRFNVDKMLPISHTLDTFEWSSIPIIEKRL